MSEAIPEGARCSRHPDDGASAVCLRCGDFLCERCTLRTREGAPCCARCEPLAGEPFPWEQRGELGIGRALAQTLIGTITRTHELFARGFRDRSVVPALVYGVLLATPFHVATVFAIERDVLAVRFAWAATTTARIVRAVCAPLVFVLMWLVLAAGWWIGLRIVGRSRARFGEVLRTVAYVRGSMGFAALLVLLPVPIDRVAALAAALATLAIEAEALSALTGLSRWRTAGAALVLVLGLFIVLCVASALIVLVGGV